jgi:hypothetical protein
MAFEGLTAHITAEAADYNATVERAKDRTEELGDRADRVSLQMQVMQGRLDEAAEESRDLAASSTAASGGLLAMATTSSRTNFSLLALSASLTGSVLPAIGLVTGAVLALTSALAATAAAVLSVLGAFGLFIGAGVVTHLEELKQAFQDVAPRIKSALRPLGDVFGPLLEDAIRALPELTRRIVDAVGGVQQFESALRGFGRVLMQTIPPLVGAVANFARAVLPAFRRVTSYLNGSGSAVFNQLRRTFMSISDELGMFLGAVVRALPPLLKLGGTLAKGLLPILALLAEVIGFVAKGINGWITIFGMVAQVLKGPFGQAIRAVTNPIQTLQSLIVTTANAVIRLINLLNELPGVSFQDMDTISTGGVSSAVAGARGAQTRSRSTRRPASNLRASERRRLSEQNGGELPPIEIKGDTAVIEEAGFRGADRRVNEERRNVRRR